MKVIHTADIHLGASLGNLPIDKSNLRKREIVDNFYDVLKYAENNSVQAIIISGDFFDKNIVPFSLKKEVMTVIAKYPKIDVLYLRGNHDNKFEIEPDIRPSNLKMFDTSNDWTYYNYKEEVTIAGIDITKQSSADYCEKLVLEKKNFNIVVLHGELPNIQLENLKSKNIDFIALGDKHIPDLKESKLDTRGKYAYAGCLEGRGFDELGERGFFVLDIEGTKFKRTFVPTGKRKYETVKVDITGCETHADIETAVAKKLNKTDKDAIIKLELCGKYKATLQKDLAALESKLNQEFFFVKIKDNSNLDINGLVDNNDISLKSEFVKIVRNSDLPQEKIEKIVEFGIKALMGEAIEI